MVILGNEKIALRLEKKIFSCDGQHIMVGEVIHSISKIISSILFLLQPE